MTTPGERRLRGIYAVVSESSEVAALVQAILDGGARIVQYRAKSGLVPEHARRLRRLTRRHEALFIVNDDWRAVEAFDADGVHLGPEDAAPADVRAIRAALPRRLIGLSCGTPDEARAAQACGADYIGVGAVYATDSKPDAGPPIGVDGLRRVAQASTLPVAAIGGITIERLPEVARTGVAMAAVIAAIARSADPRAATADLVRAWEALRT